jgi:chromatin assembly factor 1 subunit B
MKAKVLLIAWHPLESENGKNAPILGTDFVPTTAGLGNMRVAATAGQDGVVRLWRLDETDKHGNAIAVNTGPAKAAVSEAPSPSSSSGAGRAADQAGPVVATGVAAVHLADLDGFTCSVNAVRFSPNGECLATAGDDGSVFLWGCRATSAGLCRWDCVREARHLSKRMMRGRCSEIYDVAWSPDSTCLVAGSVDGSVKVWDIVSGDVIHSIKDHRGFVQGVCWDPLNMYIATQGASSKSTVRVYKIAQKKDNKKSPFHAKQTITRRKRVLGPAEEETAKQKEEEAEAAFQVAQEEANRLMAQQAEMEAAFAANAADGTDGSAPAEACDTADIQAKIKKLLKRPRKQVSYDMYMDDLDTNTFFRRLEWTVDGSFLLTPAALCKDIRTNKTSPTVYAFMRGKFETPCFHLPGADESVPVGVRCNPLVYELKKGPEGSPSPVPWVALPYRMVFAVATMNAVIVYDTQHPAPIALIRNLHFANLTDVSWSPEGNMLLMSSTDGYCSVAVFEDGELGTPVVGEARPEAMRIKHEPYFFSTERKSFVDRLQESKKPKIVRARAPSAYLLFCKAERAELKNSSATDPGPKEILKLLGAKWTAMLDAEKEKYKVQHNELQKKLDAEAKALAESSAKEGVDSESSGQNSNVANAVTTSPPGKEGAKPQKRRIQLIPVVESTAAPGETALPTETVASVNTLVPKKKRAKLIQVVPQVVVPGETSLAAPVNSVPVKKKKRVQLIPVTPVDFVPGDNEPAPKKRVVPT